MAKEYDFFRHRFVMVNLPKDHAWPESVKEDFRTPWELVLHVKERVWFAGTYMCTNEHPDMLQVGDGQTNGFGPNGECIMSVPAEWCEYFDEIEAQGIMQGHDADDQLLSYAR